MTIRTAARKDTDAIRRVYRSTFPEGERDLVAQLAIDLLGGETVPPVVALVAEADGMVVGHVAFSPVKTSGTQELLGHLLAPLAVIPDYEKRGIGSRLVRDGIGRLSRLGPGVLLVYGDPAFYGRFGFEADVAKSFTPPYRLRHPLGWQGMWLGEPDATTSAVDISCASSFDNPDLW